VDPLVCTLRRLARAPRWPGAALACAGLWLAAAPASASIVGLCPDGSLFVVKRRQDVPCANAKEVAPDEVPPLRPSYLPRPYAWEVFHARQDPNNPYNLVDSARAVREAGAPPPEGAGETAPAPPAPPPPELASAPRPAPPPPQPREVALALSPEEKRDLALLVELSQERAPATLAQDADGKRALVLRLAHSRAFEARLHAAAHAAGRPARGSVVLWSAEAAAPASFHANLTFAQAHTAFHPEHGDPAQFGVLEGEPGNLAAGERVLGYVVLPAELDATQPLDVYWDDRRLVTTLRP
jgi:hypothetical protein